MKKKKRVMKKMIVLASLAAALLVGNFANAQGRYNNNTQFNQKVKIHKGVQRGTLTRAEARQLQMQQARIAQMKRRAMADGFVSSRERMMIRRAEQEANFAIRMEKRDRDFRW
jgi:uncharacterized membrane protein YebE (DUF533 family)